MSFGARVAVASAAAVALAIVLASGLVYVVVRGELRGEVDAALRTGAERVLLGPGHRLGFEVATPRLGGAAGYVQLVAADGRIARLPGADIPLPSEEATAVAGGARDAFFEDLTVAGTHVRVLTTPAAPGLAIQIARPLDEVDRTLDRLAVILGLVSAGGIALAAGAGLVVARTALAPVRRLTATAEHVAATRDLSRRIDSVGGDELGRLAGSFNAMLEALAGATAAQRRLVEDASHELRTPLTSLRTNVEVLERNAAVLPDEERQRILADVRAELEELTHLVGDLVELARGEEPPGDPEPVRLDELVARAVETARRHAPGVGFVTRLEPSTVRAVPDRLERAIANLLDNAAKWSPPGGTVEVAVADGEVTVRDHGPGIEEEDLPRVFDRFYRARAARAVPGSGLGLAIVRQVAEEHGGTVSAETVSDGGARLRLRLAATS
jgi:two-component system sensor histidine kinase MprB